MRSWESKGYGKSILQSGGVMISGLGWAGLFIAGLR